MSDFILYPLREGDTLTNFDWWPFYGDLFDQSDFLDRALEHDRHDWIGAALLLWHGVLRQDPGGCVADNDSRLARLAKLPLDRWREMRPEILRGWFTVHVETRDGGHVERITHKMLMAVAQEQMRRKNGNRAATVAASDRQKRKRIADKLLSMESGLL